MIRDIVRDLVCWVTDISKPSDGNRAYRKSLDRQHIMIATAWLHDVVEDTDITLDNIEYVFGNASSIQAHDPDFTVTYMREKRELLKVLTDGDADLHYRATRIVADYFKANPQHI